MPPKELPGFFWDAAKQRYFPLSSQPVGGPSNLPHDAATTSNAAEVGRHKRRKVEPEQVHATNTWTSINQLRGGTTYSAINKFAHTLQLQRAAKPYCLEMNTLTNDDVASFAVSEQDGRHFVTVGAQSGWIYNYEHGLSNTPSRELFLGSEVRTVCTSGDIRVAVPFGACEFAVQSRASTEMSVWTILRIMDKNCHDVRDAHLMNRSLLLGAARRGILLPDVVHSATYRFLPTKSDVMSVFQVGQLCYTGCRNGSIQAFDRRLDTTQKGQGILSGKFEGSYNSVIHLSVVNEWQLLVSTIGGNLQSYDLRFARNADPVMRFQGHCNRYTDKLGIATSPTNDLLFAANDEFRVNAWSLRTAERIEGIFRISEASALSQTPTILGPQILTEPFPDEIPALQVTEGGANDDGSLSLWVASGKALYRYNIGQRPECS